MGLEHRKGAHSVHAIAYHLVWCVKYRKTLLTRQIGDRVKEIVTEQANLLGCEILEIETDTDHVHVLVRVKPTHQLSKLVVRTSFIATARSFATDSARLASSSATLVRSSATSAHWLSRASFATLSSVAAATAFSLAT
ncbi:MAG: IS200/IS605 family transposase [Acidobacteriota bacterium]